MAERDLAESISVFDISARVFKSIANSVLDAGGNMDDLRRLEKDNELRRKIGELVVGPKPTLSRDMRKEGWTLLEHGPRRINSMDGLKLVPVLKSGEDRVNGEEMVRRARVELDANYGQEDAEWLFDHQDLIPKEWRQFYISFPRTVWRGQDGHRHVPYLIGVASGGIWTSTGLGTPGPPAFVCSVPASSSIRSLVSQAPVRQLTNRGFFFKQIL